MTVIKASTDPSSAPSILDTTAISSPKYTKLVERYSHYIRKVAEDFIELGKIILYADAYLEADELERFCNEVRLERSGPTYRKMKVIGEKAVRFEPFIAKLPNTWTTLYKLASLKDDEFDRVTKSDRLSTFMTAKDVASVLDTNEPKTKASRDVVIDFCALPKKKRLEMFSRLQELAQEYGCAIEPSKEVRELVARNIMSPSVVAFLADLGTGNE